ncbi:MAG TPA: hypothetical protein VK666_20585 [Chryseolinea sp.]|nr:hypothetical protein [Chryseolinea sp.]
MNRIAGWKSLLIFFALDILFNGFILPNAGDKINALAGKTTGVIDLTFGFNPQKTLTMVADYGDEARAYYARTELTTDMVYPIVYAFLAAIILTLLYRNTPYSRVNLIPFLCLIFDYLENITIVTLLLTYPQQSSTVATLCEIVKLIKWLTFGVLILLVIGGLILKLVRRPRIG